MNASTEPASVTTGFTVTGVEGFPEVEAGTDLAGLIADAAPGLADGDIVVVTSKIVSKAEGRVIESDRERAIDAETIRLVARRGATRIVETRHGLVLAAAGVDNSNTLGGPWRNGQTDAAIGAAGVLPVRDYRGQPDTFGTPLSVTVAAVADEI